MYFYYIVYPDTLIKSTKELNFPELTPLTEEQYLEYLAAIEEEVE